MFEEVILGFGLLFNPMGSVTPARGIEVVHFGNKVQLNDFDEAFDKAAAPWKNDKDWNWMTEGNAVSGSTRVMVAPFYTRSQECLREVEWSVVPTSTKTTMASPAYTIVVSPRLAGTDRMKQDLESAYSKLLQIVSVKAEPTAHYFEGCAD